MIKLRRARRGTTCCAWTGQCAAPDHVFFGFALLCQECAAEKSCLLGRSVILPSTPNSVLKKFVQIPGKTHVDGEFRPTVWYWCRSLDIRIDSLVLHNEFELHESKLA